MRIVPGISRRHLCFIKIEIRGKARNIIRQYIYFRIAAAIRTFGAVHLFLYIVRENVKGTFRLMVSLEISLELEILRPVLRRQAPDLLQVGDHVSSILLAGAR